MYRQNSNSFLISFVANAIILSQCKMLRLRTLEILLLLKVRKDVSAAVLVNERSFLLSRLVPRYTFPRKEISRKRIILVDDLTKQCL